MKKQYVTHALVMVDWRSQSQIGRKLPPFGSNSLAMTAKFINDNDPELFSVVLQYPIIDSNMARSEQVKLHFFAPQLIMPKLENGTMLYLIDGSKTVGKATISKVMK